MNLLIHNLFIVITNYILKSKPSYLWIIFSNILDIIYLVLYLLFPYEFEMYQFIYIFLISITPFMKRRFKISLLSCLIYLFLNFMLGGTSKIIYSIINNFFSVLLSIFLIFIGFIIVTIYKKINVSIDKLDYELIIKEGNSSIFIKGFCDTGNMLVTEENIPIVFLDSKYKIGRYKRKLLINTVTNNDYIDLYEVEEFKIKIRNKYVTKDVYIAFTTLNTCCMFGLSLLGG